MDKRSYCLVYNSALCFRYIIYWVIGFALLLHFGQSSQIKLDNNGYTGIVVALSPHIPETEGKELISRIKELFTSASQALYTATRRRAYFEQVTILVPESWHPEYEMSGTETFETADVRIDEPNPKYGDGPYTFQTLGCGSPGLYIHLTPDYLHNIKGTAGIYFGDPGKTFVHEWAHLRYGIFDEFGYPGDSMYPMFYYEDDDLLPNYCANGRIRGVYKDVETDGPCQYGEDGQPNPSCVFKPHVDYNDDITSSIASYHFLKNVETFCDDGETYYHNPTAPNKHNAMCEGNSTWNIILQSEDFKDGRNSALPLSDKRSLEPNFKIVQEKRITYALVLDTSASMKEKVEGSTLPRSHILQSTVKNWLQNEVPLGTTVGIISYNSVVNNDSYFKVIENDDGRDEIISKIPVKFIGATMTGKALNRTRIEMKKYRNGPGGIIILVTDGEETKNEGHMVIDQIPLLVQNQVRLIAILLHTDGNLPLEEAAKATGGKLYYIPSNAGIEKVGMAFSEALTYQYNEQDLPLKIHTNKSSANLPFFAGHFVIDTTIGKDTIVDVLTDNTQNIENIFIRGPDLEATKLTATVTESSLIRFRFPSLKVGIYHYNVTRANTDLEIKFQISVTSEAISSSIAPFITRCWIQEAQSSTDAKPKFIILAEVQQGNKPVVKAAVIAKVDRPDNSSVIVQLFDNGNGSPDVTRDDGVYSRYFTQLKGKGRYSISAQVSDEGKAAVAGGGFTGSRSMPIIHDFQTNPTIAETKTGPFERHVSGGSFRVVHELDEDIDDLYPPSRVGDLRVTFISEDDSFVLLKWTAPGDDADRGKASSYDIRYSSNWNHLKVTFNACPKLDIDKSPQPAGTEESLSTSLPGLASNVPIYVALKAVDKANQMSQLSNIVTVSGNVRAPVPPVVDSSSIVPATATGDANTVVSGATTSANTTVSDVDTNATSISFPPEEENNDTIVIVVGAVLAVAVVVIFVVGFTLYRKKRSRVLILTTQ